MSDFVHQLLSPLCQFILGSLELSGGLSYLRQRLAPTRPVKGGDASGQAPRIGWFKHFRVRLVCFMLVRVI